MLKKTIITWIFCTSSLIAFCQSPNILLVIADDLGKDALNGFGESNLMPTTPTLDSLRSAGVSFHNVWGTPMCTSTRASIMSGLHGNKTGVQGTPGNLDTTFTSVLKQLETSPTTDYAKSVIGKWHISNRPVDPLHPLQTGADYYVGFLEAFPTTYDVWDKTENGQTVIENSYITSTLTDKSIEWINNQSKPWFLWLAHAAPHSPYHVPPSNMYTINSTNGNVRKYLAMIESLDYEINRLLYSLSEEDRNNTIVIFIGDNGTGSQVIREYPDDHAKGTIYEGGIAVPMIIAGKGVTRQGEVDSSLINLTDLYSTILDLSGEPMMDEGYGNSLSFKHLLTSSSGQTRDYNFMEFQDGPDYYWATRNERYKLIELKEDSFELYDLIDDPLENNPIDMSSLSEELQSIVNDLKDESEATRNGYSCRDHIKNGDETGIDCGGSCAPCMNSVGSFESHDIIVYPNPSTSTLNIESTNDRLVALKMFNTSGTLILSENDIQSNHADLTINTLIPGVYILEVLTNKGIRTQRVIKL